MEKLFAFLLDNLFSIFTLFLLSFIAFGKNIKVKRFKAGPGGIEYENMTDADAAAAIDPNAKCPYNQAYSETWGEIRQLMITTATLEQIVATLQTENEKSLRKVSVNQLKIVLRLPTSPPEDRILAGLECLLLGENSWILKDTVGLVRQHPDLYKILCTARPDLRNDEVDKQITVMK